MKGLRWAMAALLVMLATSVAAAQSGGLKIKVTDEENLPLPGATVMLENEMGYVKQTAYVTDARGVVDFPVLRPGGGYKITVTFPGYAPIVSGDLRVRISQMVTVPVQMLAAIEERVKVTATRDVIDLDKSESTTKFDEGFISDLPIAGRQYQSVLSLAPGVQDPDGDGNPTVHGSRSRDFQTQVSGVNNTDPLTGRWMSRVNPNSIEEMEVITAGAGVEFGRAQGGFATIIQKQGSNEHEGVFEFFLKTSTLDKDGAKSRDARPTPSFETLTPSFQLSGPLVRDTLWYRLSHEFEKREDPLNLITGTEIITQNRSTNSDQITWQVSPRNKLAVLFQSDPLEILNAGVSRTTPSEASFDYERNGETISMTWDAPYSPKVLVGSTFAWQDLEQIVRPTQLGQMNACLASENPREQFLVNASCNNIDEQSRSGSWWRTLEDHSQRFSLKSQATIFGGRIWGMDHQFKLGVSIENERYFRSLQESPSLSYRVIDSPNDDPDEGQEDEINTFGLVFARLAVPAQDDIRATGTNWGLFAEDQFRPTSNLTVTLGVRVDREEINSEGYEPMNLTAELDDYEQRIAPIASGGQGLNPGQVWPVVFTGYEDTERWIAELQNSLCRDLPIELRGNCENSVESGAVGQTKSLAFTRRAENINIANTNFSPRVSVAWSPWSNGKTAFRFAAGRNYNNIPLIIPLQELTPATTNVRYDVNISNDDVGGAPQRNGTLLPLPNVSTVRRDLRTPFQDELVFSVERELWAETSAKLSYINREYKDQIQDRNINVDTGDYGRCRIQQSAGGTPVVASPGSGFEITDPWSGITYIDTDDGPGDGRLDDCVGNLDVIDTSGAADPDPFGGDAFLRPSGDEIDDLYVQNPFWGDVYEIGNYNSADYSAFVLELTRRQYRNWQMTTSYTWSKSKGDGEDFFQAIGDDPSLRDNVRGFQSNDQRHVVKVVATTITPWGLRLGTNVTWQSGLPYSVLIEAPSNDVLPITTSNVIAGGGLRIRQQYRDASGFLPRNSARNESYWNVDLRVAKELTIGKNVNLQLTAELFNALADDTFIVYNANAEAGTEVNQFADGYYRFGRQWTLGMKLAF